MGKKEEQKVYYLVIDYIKQLVKENKIGFGGKIPSERELMETLGYSRNSIREALRTLEHMGLIESRQGKGNYLVNQMGESLNSIFSMLIFMKESDYLEVNQVRRAIESQAFYLALDRIGEAERSRFREIMENMEKADHQSKVQADHDFHQMLIQCSGNRLLELVMQALSQVCKDEIALILDNAAQKYTDRWLELHEKIYHCLLAGDRTGGLEAILGHYQWIDQGLEEMGTVG